MAVCNFIIVFVSTLLFPGWMAEIGFGLYFSFAACREQEQLGLRLESRKGPVEFIVIEHAEMPSDN